EDDRTAELRDRVLVPWRDHARQELSRDSESALRVCQEIRAIAGSDTTVDNVRQECLKRVREQIAIRLGEGEKQLAGAGLNALATFEEAARLRQLDPDLKADANAPDLVAL